MTSTLTLLRKSTLALAAVSLLSFSSCTTLQQPGTGLGALLNGPTNSDAGGEKPAAPSGDVKHPTGYKTQNPSHVISPYTPHNLIDISKNPKTGQPFQSGDLVKDPSNSAIFRIP